MCYFPVLTAIEGDTMSPDFIPCEPGVSHLYPSICILYLCHVNYSVYCNFTLFNLLNCV